MTKQEAAALLRDAARNASHESVALLDSEALAIADLLDPPREGLVEVDILIGWDRDGDWWDACGFGPNHSYAGDQSKAGETLENAKTSHGWTRIRAYVPRPVRTVAQVEGDVEG